MVFRAMGGTGWGAGAVVVGGRRPSGGGGPEQTFQLEATIVQSNKPFRFPLQLRIHMEGDREHMS